MKNALVLSILLITQLAKPAFAQTQESELQAPIVNGEYLVVEEKAVVINNQAYIKYELERQRNPNLDRLLLAGNVLVTGAAAYGTLKWKPKQDIIKQDKLMHVMAGYVIGNVTNAGFQLLLPSDMKHRKLYSFIAGVGASVLVGVGKEVRDSMGYGTPDYMDAVATGAGGAMGSLTMSFTDVSNAFKRAKNMSRTLNLNIH